MLADVADVRNGQPSQLMAGQGVMFAAVNGKLAGLLVVADPIKESAAGAIDQLHTEGIRVVMLTGDNRQTAAAVANRLGSTK